MTGQLNFATLKFDPTEPRTSEAHPDWAAQHSVKVAVFGPNGQPDEHRIWFAEGEFSQLKKGDRIAVEWRQGRWRMAPAQPADLLGKLAQRRGETPAAPAAPPPSPEARREKIEAYVSSMAKLYGYCYTEASKALSPQGAPPEAVIGAAFRLWHCARDKYEL